MTKSPTPETPSTPSVSPDASSPDKTRRTLAGLGASAIFTLASRPVLAVTCNSPSAHASGNLSFHGTPPDCTGLTPAQWVTANPSEINNVKFSSIFADASGRVEWGNDKLKTVMGAAATSEPLKPNPISAEFAATWLNIDSGRIPVLTKTQLVGMWNEWISKGQFIPTVGAMPWLAADIVEYLQSLQGPAQISQI